FRWSNGVVSPIVHPTLNPPGFTENFMNVDQFAANAAGQVVYRASIGNDPNRGAIFSWSADKGGELLAKKGDVIQGIEVSSVGTINDNSIGDDGTAAFIIVKANSTESAIVATGSPAGDKA